MSTYDQARTSETSVAQETSTESEVGYDSEEQCALPEGCDSEIPPLDDIFWEGFTDLHGSLMGDLASVTSHAMDLQSQLPSPDHAADLDLHIDGVFGLESALAVAIESAQAGAAWGDEGEVTFDDEAVAEVEDLWDRIEVALDLLREHNALYAAILAEDLAGMLETFARFGADVVEAGIKRSLEEARLKTEAQLAAFDEAWKHAAVSVAQIPAHVAVDVAVGAAITAGVPLVLGALGVTGTLPAVLLAGGIAIGIGAAADLVIESWGTDVNDLHAGLGDLNGAVDLGADATAIDHVGQGFKGGAEKVGSVTLWLGVLMDAVESGVAIDGIYQAQAAWEGFLLEHKKYEQLWDQAAILLGGLVRCADGMKAAIAGLRTMMDEKLGNIRALTAEYGEALYAV